MLFYAQIALKISLHDFQYVFWLDNLLGDLNKVEDFKSISKCDLNFNNRGLKIGLETSRVGKIKNYWFKRLKFVFGDSFYDYQIKFKT